MSWQEREYNQGRWGGGFGGWMRALWEWSLPLGTWFGIRVRAHSSLVIFIGLTLLLAPLGAGGDYALAMKHAATSMAILFGIVLLHEFGHCVAARGVGGFADDILLSPLGGLAFTSPPRRPLATFITVAAGPAVNVLICIATATALWALNNHQWNVPLNPLRPHLLSYVPTGISFYLWWVYFVSYALLLFNLLPIFPLDGGQMLQTILWPAMGYFRSMRFACNTGMAGALIVAGFGLWHLNLLLVTVALFGFQYCYQRRMILMEMGPGGVDEMLEMPVERTRHHHRISRRVIRRVRKRAAREQAEQARIDAILAKVSAHGMRSLNWRERRALHRETARQRERDLEVSRNQ